MTRTSEPTPQDNAEIVERVAKQIALWTYASMEEESDEDWGWLLERDRIVFREAARAAIRSLSSSRGEVR